jgi:hypothetical protein
MKSTKRVAGWIAVTAAALTLTTLGRGALAASEPDSADAVQMQATAARETSARVDLPASAASAPMVLLVKNVAGNMYRLTYVANEGWSLDEPGRALRPNEARLTPTAISVQGEDDSAAHPLTVFIDGPTGFTYVWIRDQGWKFVGRIADRAQ